MNIKIDPETVKKADQCPHDHACLKEGGRTCCSIRDTINQTVFFTTCKKPSICPYQISFGNTFICNCPVRQELHVNHWI